jgi:hypothetical protein
MEEDQMAKYYEVQLTKPMIATVYASDYFPRKMRYKKDAVKLVARVREMGGDAKAVRS